MVSSRNSVNHMRLYTVWEVGKEIITDNEEDRMNYHCQGLRARGHHLAEPLARWRRSGGVTTDLNGLITLHILLILAPSFYVCTPT